MTVLQRLKTEKFILLTIIISKSTLRKFNIRWRFYRILKKRLISFNLIKLLIYLIYFLKT